MRSCPACGTANGESDDFCGNCGGYLGWSSQPARSRRAAAPEPEPEPEPGPGPEPAAAQAPVAAAGPEPRPTPEPEPEPGPAGPPTRRSTPPPPAAHPGPQAPAPAPETPVPSGPAPSEGTPPPAGPAPARPEQPPEPPRSAPPPAPPRPTAPPANSAPTTGPVGPVRPTPAPVRPGIPDSAPGAAPASGRAPDGDEGEGPIGAVQPARPVARRPVVRPVEADEAPDGPPCPACGTPNLPGRRFCRRCAAPLDAREQPAALPWWRTVWPFRRRVRGGSGRALRRTLLVLAVAGLLVAGFLFFPLGRYVYEDVRDKLGGTAEISPTGVTASASAPGHPATAATDGLTNKYWGAPALGASLTSSFAAPFRLVGVVVHTGVSKEPQEFRRGARPTRAELIVTTKDDKVHKKTVTFNDKPGKQETRLGISDVVSVRLVLREATGQGEGRPIAVGEVEFFRRT
ncbi:NADase-type glycan-binding domain-containing protein [Streptomyces griseus]|uniref:NADase-type glycan-binding domain-containing protein n=1 Tax=Streptomyces griseus TaxID=1911 RepID=UPI0036FB3BAF